MGDKFFSWERNRIVDFLLSNISSFEANPDIRSGSSNMYLGGYFSAFGKQLDLLGIKFLTLHFGNVFSLFGKETRLIDFRVFQLPVLGDKLFSWGRISFIG